MPPSPSVQNSFLAKITFHHGGSFVFTNQNGAFEFPIHPRNDAIKIPSLTERTARSGTGPWGRARVVPCFAPRRPKSFHWKTPPRRPWRYPSPDSRDPGPGPGIGPYPFRLDAASGPLSTPVAGPAARGAAAWPASGRGLQVPLRLRWVIKSLKESSHRLGQGGDLVARHIPDDGIVHREVGVGQDVPETGDAFPGHLG